MSGALRKRRCSRQTNRFRDSRPLDKGERPTTARVLPVTPNPLVREATFQSSDPCFCFLIVCAYWKDIQLGSEQVHDGWLCSRRLSPATNLERDAAICTPPRVGTRRVRPLAGPLQNRPCRSAIPTRHGLAPTKRKQSQQY
jgi:hypothetical protein